MTARKDRRAKSVLDTDGGPHMYALTPDTRVAGFEPEHRP
jgi:hypothetical protein